MCEDRDCVHEKCPYPNKACCPLPKRESSIPSTDLLCEIMRIADHQIPGYAFGDNQAACDMDNRLREIYMTLEQYTHND